MGGNISSAICFQPYRSKVFSPATKNKRQSMKPCLYGMKLIPAYFIGQKWVIAHLLENLIEIYL